jgi:hypothetical protein
LEVEQVKRENARITVIGGHGYMNDRARLTYVLAMTRKKRSSQDINMSPS